MRRYLCSALLVLAACSLGNAQTYESTVKTTRTAFVLRVQRVERYSSACAVVYPGDKVHYEQGLGVYEGTLSGQAAEQVQLLVPPLEQIDPSAIAHHTRLEDVDMVIVNVPTARGVRNLQFSDSAVRKPFKTAMDPTLKWLGSLSHQHLAEVKGAKPGACMPQDSVEPGSAKTPPALSAAMGRSMGEHMLLRAYFFGADESLLHERCMLVLPGGEYRYETSSIAEDNKRNTKVYAATLTPEELSTLKQILDEPQIKDAEHTAEPPNGLPARDVESIELTIPRPDRLQTLKLFNVTGVASQFVNTKVTTDLDEHAMRPLRAFLHNSIEKRKGVTPIANAAPNRCSSY